MPDSLDALEWPRLFARLLDECSTPYGVRHWQDMPFLPDAEAVRRHLDEVDALKILLVRYNEPTGLTRLPDVTALLERLAKGGLLTLDETHRLHLNLKQGHLIEDFIRRHVKKEPRTDVLSGLLAAFPEISAVTGKLDHYLEEDGRLRETASPTLAGLSRKRRDTRKALQDKLQSYLGNPNLAKAFAGHSPTERDGRYVLPVQASFKSQVPGMVHGTSATGATLYIEPQGAVELNNTLVTVESEIQREIDRVLREICDFLGEHLGTLTPWFDALGALDRRLGAARLGIRLKAEPPEVVENGHVIDLRQMRHPLLVLGTTAETVVPNDFQLGGDVRTLVITGPNTGGKTVVLKAAGLCALMLKAGLHLPVAEGSRMSLFLNVLAEIGDQQNIEQNLSTFSAHMTRLQHFLSAEQLEGTLVLIDEITAGTDPAEGQALAKAILDTFYEKSALSVVTTHLGELKVEAHQHPGYLNASVEFDADTLSPTYRLMMGIPGTSNAITIARRLGLDDAIVAKAQAALSAPARDSAQLIEELERQNRKLKEELHMAEMYRKEAQASYEKAEAEKRRIEAEKRKTLDMFRTGLKSRIHDLNRDVKRMRKDMQTDRLQDTDEAARQLKELEKGADELLENAQQEIGPGTLLSPDDIRLGDTLESKRLNVSGEVVSVSGDEITLQVGLMKINVPVTDLQPPLSRRQAKKRHHQEVQTQSRVPAPSILVSGECDVRGFRAEEALEAVEKFLDEAVLANRTQVGIIHGLGTGALKRAIRQYLDSCRHVKRHYPAEAMDGGDGKTIVELQ